MCKLTKLKDIYVVVTLVAVCLTGCAGATLDSVKRKPLQIAIPEISMDATSEKVLIYVEKTIPDAPLSETVWDNASGAFRDSTESHQIGYTQNYSMIVPAALVGGAPVAGAVGSRPDYTRIVIPFGRLFEVGLESGVSKVLPESTICKDDACMENRRNTGDFSRVLSVRIVSFQVWEEPMNHLNMRAEVKCDGVGQDDLDYTFSVHHEISKQRLGGIMSTSSDFIQEMNNLSNRFAGDVVDGVLRAIQKRGS